LIKTFKVPPTGILYNRLRWSPDGSAVLYKDVVQGLWRQPLTGEKPEPIAGPDDFRIVHLAVSGDALLYSGGVGMREIIVLEGLADN
jgi:hypothetical protein